MKSIFIRFSLLTVIMITALTSVRAQGLPGVVQNLELGYGYSKAWADYKRIDRAIRTDGKLYDTTYSLSVSSKFGYSGSFGTSIPLKRLGRVSKLALGVSLVYNAYAWDYPTANGAFLTDSGLRYDYSKGFIFSSATLNTGLAISADFKFGTDALMDKQYHWSWTGGVGVMPSMNVTADFDNADAKFGVQPFVKTEVGFLAGIVVKLRLMYQMGPLTYLDTKPGTGFVPNSQQTIQLIGKGNFSASLILMPFSFMYKRGMWYNSY